MKRIRRTLEQYWKYAFVLILSVGIIGCSDDDDGDEITTPDEPTGTITAMDQTISQNTIIVQNVTVEQDSWLVARNAGEEEMAGIISEPVFIETGTGSNIEVVLNNSAVLTGDGEDEITLMLHVDDDTDGTQGEFDYDTTDGVDAIITDDQGAAVRETITVTSPSVETDDTEAVTDNSITINSADLPNGGWIVLYNEDEQGNRSDEIIGYQYVPAGNTEPVTISFDDDFTYTPGQNIYATVHLDDPADEVFDYENDPNSDIPDYFGYDDAGEPVWISSKFIVDNDGEGGAGEWDY